MSRRIFVLMPSPGPEELGGQEGFYRKWVTTTPSQ